MHCYNFSFFLACTFSHLKVSQDQQICTGIIATKFISLPFCCHEPYQYAYLKICLKHKIGNKQDKKVGYWDSLMNRCNVRVQCLICNKLFGINFTFDLSFKVAPFSNFGNDRVSFLYEFFQYAFFIIFWLCFTIPFFFDCLEVLFYLVE